MGKLILVQQLCLVHTEGEDLTLRLEGKLGHKLTSAISTSPHLEFDDNNNTRVPPFHDPRFTNTLDTQDTFENEATRILGLWT
jgi:hypothetical protein